MLLFVVALACVACGHQPHKIAWPDAPLELGDDTDRSQAIDHLLVMPAGPERDAERNRIAAATAHRINDVLDEDHPIIAAGMFDQLVSLWSDDPQDLGPGLRPHVALVERLRATFAKSGAVEPTLLALVVLMEAEPQTRARRQDELDEVLGFTDDLAVAENGPNAVRAQPIAQLGSVVFAVPLPWLVDRFVKLVEERQRTVSQLLATQGGSIQLVRAHHDILNSARKITGALARGGRVGDIAKHLQTLKGTIGTDREIMIRATIIAEQPTPEAYVQLAKAMVTDTHENERFRDPDPGASLAICRAGLVKFPKDADLLGAAASYAGELSRIDQPIALYEASLDGASEVDTVRALKLGKLYSQRIQRLAAGGRPTAATKAWHGIAKYVRDVSHHRPHDVWDQVHAIAEGALGRGLVSQGQLDDAEHALVDSIDHAPSIDAYETLALLDYQLDKLGPAQKWASQGLAMLGDGLGDRFRKAKLERLAADIERHMGHNKEALAMYLDSLRTWASLGETKDLPKPIAAERLLESGRAMFYLGDPSEAVKLVLDSVDEDPDTAAITSGAVAFLLGVSRYSDALDAFHRGLGSTGVGDYYKVYMALWIVAESQRAGEPRDRLATEYLTSRKGDLWYELLAEAATGRADLAKLRAVATTGPRKAELAFYSAVLGFDPSSTSPASTRKLLEEMVAAHLVMDAEYDLARRYLAR